MGLSSFKKKRWRGNLKFDYKYLLGGHVEDGVRLFEEVHSRRMRGHKHGLQHGKYLLDVRKLLFVMRMFTRDVVESSELN